MPTPMQMPADPVRTEPGLAILRMAALLAEDDGALDEEPLDAMAEHSARGALRATPAAAMSDVAPGARPLP